MIEFPFINKLLVFLIDVVAVGLGLMVYFNNPKGKMNKIFILMVILMLFWVNFAYFARIFRDIIFLKTAWFVTPLFFVFLYFLVIYLLEKEKEYQLLNRIVLIIGGITTVLTGFTGLIIKGTKFTNGDLTIIYGEGMFPFLTIISFLIVATLYLLIKWYLKSPPGIKEKIEYFLVGIFIFYIANIIFNIFFPVFLGIVRFYYIGDYSAIFLLGFTGYAIVAKELFGIRVILTQILVGAIAVLLLWQAIVATNVFEFAWKIILFLLFLIFGYFLIQSVIREIKRRAELQQLYKKVDKLSKAKSEFISIASHQLRTPLTAVKGYISMIMEGTYGKLSEIRKII
jgi:signal transduction histidine kinase